MSVMARVAVAAVLATGLCACSGAASDSASASAPVAKTGGEGGCLPLTIKSANGPHAFCVESASTAAAQEKGLMYRTDLKPDGGMLFAPYPPTGGPPKTANFWMKNTPTPLDIIFIRADRTIAHIAENTVPFSEAMVPSGEPVGAVLEIVGGRSADLGVAEGDTVTWADAKAVGH